MMFTLMVEKASIKDLDKLFEIEGKCFGFEAFTKEQLAYLLFDRNNVSLIAKINGEIVGFIIGRINFNGGQTVGHVLTVDVSPKHRRKGVGLKLLTEIEKVFKERGVKICYLEAREDNFAALNLYQKKRYKRVKKLRNYYGYVHGIRFMKILA